jgi:hypothetical protein
VYRVYELLGLLHFSKVCRVNTLWYEVCCDVWKPLIEKRIGFSKVSCGTQWMIDFKLELALKQVYDQFIQDPVTLQKDVTIFPSLLQHIEHLEMKQWFPYSTTLVDQAHRGIQLNTDDLDKLKQNIAFGYAKSKCISLYEDTDSKCTEFHRIVHFTLYNPDNKGVMLFKCKAIVRYSKYKELCTTLFDMVATWYESSGIVKTFTDIVSYKSHEYSDDDQGVYVQLLNSTMTLSINRDKLECMSGYFGIFDFKCLLQVVLSVVDLHIIHDKFIHVTIPKNTIEQKITNRQIVNLAEIHQYVYGMYSKVLLIQKLTACQQLFCYNRNTLPWLDSSSLRYKEIMNLTENITTLHINSKDTGCSQLLGIQLYY